MNLKIFIFYFQDGNIIQLVAMNYRCPEFLPFIILQHNGLRTFYYVCIGNDVPFAIDQKSGTTRFDWSSRCLWFLTFVVFYLLS